MTDAFVTPEVIAWALRRAGMTDAAAAKRVKVPESRLIAWQLGKSRPTLSEAESLAHALHIPFGFLFLSRPPSLEIPVPDLRTLGGPSRHELSSEFVDVLYDSLRKQEWYRSYLEDERAAPLPFIGRFSTDSSVEAIAAEIDHTLAISREVRQRANTWGDFLNDLILRAEAVGVLVPEVRQRANTWGDFLNDLILRAEAVGVLVLTSSVVANNTHRRLSVEEFRGFVISDDLAPLIFLNGADAKSARIFTVAHELAHLWIGQSGISNPDYRKRAREHAHPIERLCDRVAAQALVPKTDFLVGWDSRASLGTNITQLTRHFRVSRIVILRRAYELERVTDSEYRDYFNKTRPLGERAKGQGGGGDFYKNLLVRNSRRFARTLVEAVLQRRISDQTAARLLNVQTPVFRRFTQELTGSTGG